jgi:xanthine/CO dehydrogenase XdhC/CoxF family maturation factor
MKEIKDIVNAFENAVREGKKTALATVVHVEGSSYRRPGARMLVTEDGQLTGAISGGCLEGDALRKAVLAINQKKNKLVIYDTTDEDDAKFGIQLGCNGVVSILFEPIDMTVPGNPIQVLRSVIERRKSAIFINGYSLNKEEHLGTCDPENLPDAVHDDLRDLSKQVLINGNSVHAELLIGQNRQQFFIEYYQPPVLLIIVGAGNDALPLTAIAHIVGWKVTIVDGRNSHATLQRFSQADRLLVGKPNELIDQLVFDERTAAVLMTHNYNYDIEMLGLLSDKPLSYIGLLGPASKRDRMFSELERNGIVLSEESFQKIYGPTGLDLGAEAAEEIALSIVSEIMVVMLQKDPIHLRQKQTAIHQHQL